ncbi:MFS transporter [Yoonia sp.]|uniref:MFS transporter n=1 Tax=Yoonia sp. TaxID=2212373 RepID=UPI0019DDB86A|nr:MFS transporter [Yoonia sp.]MBE0413875.1 MFS transporter [Yoonia sp.]
MIGFATYVRFVRDNAPFLLVGALLTMLSSFGQTFFIAVFGGEIRAEFGLSNGEWGLIYMFSTAASAVAMVFMGGLVDKFRVRTLGILVVGLLASSCFAMAINPYAAMLPFVIFALRFFGQGMVSHVALVAMARWFIATRGRALAIASLGIMLAEAAMPITLVWLKGFFAWQTLWFGTGIIALLLMPVLYRLLRLERTPQSSLAEDHVVGMDCKHWTRKDVLRHPLFWSLMPALLFFPAFGTSFWFHQVHFAEIKGWDHLSIVAMLPLGTVALVTSSFAYGAAIDKFGAGRLFPIYLLPLCIAFTLHWYAPTPAWSAIAVVLMGIAGGGQATLPIAIWAEFFGTRNIGSIKSMVAAVMVLGTAIGPGLSGVLIDLGFGFEQQMLVFAASFLLAALISIAPLKRAIRQLPTAT